MAHVDDTGARFITQLRDPGGSGLVLSTLREDGHVTAEMVTRLPAEIAEDYEATLLTAEDPGFRRLLVCPGNRPFKEHSLDASELSPLVLDRDTRTIPTVSARSMNGLVDEPGFGAAPMTLVHQPEYWQLEHGRRRWRWMGSLNPMWGP